MKKAFTFLHNDSGFYFPIVLVINILVTSFLAVLILTYNNNITITNTMIDNIKVHSIIQMVKNDFSNDSTVDDAAGELTYHYPNSTVDIAYERSDDSAWIVRCDVFIENHKEPYRMSFPVNVKKSS